MPLILSTLRAMLRRAVGSTDRGRAERVPGGSWSTPRNVRGAATSAHTLRIAIGATVLLVASAVLTLVLQWRDDRRAMERGLQREVVSAAATLLERLLAERQQANYVVMAPVHAVRVQPGTSPLSLATFASAATSLLAALDLEGDSLAGAFRIDLARPWPAPAMLAAVGAPTDPERARAVLDRIAARLEGWRDSKRIVLMNTVTVHGRPLSFLAVHQLSARDGTPTAIFGMTYSASHWYARLVPQILQQVPLLPPSFYGIDWSTARPVDSAQEGTDALAMVRETSARHNGALRLQVEGPGGEVVYRSPGVGPATFTGRFATVLQERAPEQPTRRMPVPGVRVHAVPDGFAIRAALDPAYAERLVAAAAPSGAELWLLAGVAMLGALFVLAAIIQLRREAQLAEERRNFVAAISHELRTPLAHLVLLSETMLAARTLAADQRERWLRVIHRESIRLGRLVDNVLLHARADQLALRFEREPIDVGNVVREAAESVQAQADARRTSVCAVVPVCTMADADPGAIKHVLLNLLDNALRYGPEAQRVLVTAEPPAYSGDLVTLAVEDEGPGIAPEDRARIWEPFVRLGNPGGVAGGSGLGLSVVQHIVRGHGGTVHVEDAVGGGARFVVRLPAATAARPAGRSEATPSTARSRPTRPTTERSDATMA